MEQAGASLRDNSRGRIPGVRPGVLEADLLRALDRREIEVLFQPQFSCVTGAVVGAEALARWRHPTLGEIGARDLFASGRAGSAGRSAVAPCRGPRAGGRCDLAR
jgi:predicted signal transduction protein with EAL and GGDEF domain